MEERIGYSSGGDGFLYSTVRTGVEDRFSRVGGDRVACRNSDGRSWGREKEVKSTLSLSLLSITYSFVRRICMRSAGHLICTSYVLSKN